MSETTPERPTCSMPDDNCGGAPQYADGKCYWHFMHTDRNPNHLATLEDAGVAKKPAKKASAKKKAAAK